MDCQLFADNFVSLFSILKKFALQTAQDTMSYLSWVFNEGSVHDESCLYKIRKIQCSKYR